MVTRAPFLSRLWCVQMTRQVRAVQTERGLLSDVSLRAHPFVVSLLKTFQDQRRVYMLLELLPGGELWTVRAHTQSIHIQSAHTEHTCMYICIYTHLSSDVWVRSAPSLQPLVLSLRSVWRSLCVLCGMWCAAAAW